MKYTQTLKAQPLPPVPELDLPPEEEARIRELLRKAQEGYALRLEREILQEAARRPGNPPPIFAPVDPLLPWRRYPFWAYGHGSPPPEEEIFITLNPYRLRPPGIDVLRG